MITIIHVFVCAECGHSTTRTQMYGYACVPPRPVPPEDWMWIAGKIYCGLHEVRTTVGPRRVIPFPSCA